MWQSPLQHRWGCGYVHNDRYCTIEEAKKEVEDYLGQEITIIIFVSLIVILIGTTVPYINLKKN